MAKEKVRAALFPEIVQAIDHALRQAGRHDQLLEESYSVMVRSGLAKKSALPYDTYVSLDPESLIALTSEDDRKLISVARTVIFLPSKNRTQVHPKWTMDECSSRAADYQSDAYAELVARMRDTPNAAVLSDRLYALARCSKLFYEAYAVIQRHYGGPSQQVRRMCQYAEYAFREVAARIATEVLDFVEAGDFALYLKRHAPRRLTEATTKDLLDFKPDSISPKLSAGEQRLLDSLDKAELACQATNNARPRYDDRANLPFVDIGDLNVAVNEVLDQLDEDAVDDLDDER